MSGALAKQQPSLDTNTDRLMTETNSEPDDAREGTEAAAAVGVEINEQVQACFTLQVSCEILPTAEVPAAAEEEEEVSRDDVKLGDKVCRMCHLGLEAELIQLGCSCKGELGLAHEQCAKRWFKIKNSRTCEICRRAVKNVEVKLSSPKLNRMNGACLALVFLVFLVLVWMKHRA